MMRGVWSPTAREVSEALAERYSVFYVDIDGKEVTKARIRAIMKGLHRNARVRVFKTRKGIHVKAYLDRPVLGFALLPALLEFGCDPQYVRRWLERRGFAIFSVRRGVFNEQPLYTLSVRK